MNRTTLLQDRRMEKFEELLKRWNNGELSGCRGRGVFGLFGTAVPPLPTALRGGRSGRLGRPAFAMSLSRKY
jgi:hypothetical protein